MGCNKNCGLLTGTIIGAALAILGGILIPVGNNLIEDTVEKEAVIEKGTTAYENWVVPGSPIYRQFWLFDVQNPEEVMMNGSNPILKQKGPYTYRMRYKPKENITEHDDATLSYHLENIVLFQPELSNGLESDNITTVNFAVVYNETFDGPYRINSGKDDIKKVGIIQSYKNNRTVEYWKSYCALVNGTDAASFHPFLNKSEVLRFFSSDICRSFSATFDREKTVKGIPLYHFVIPPSTFASPVNNPDNICFCTESEISQNCTLNGILDLGPCKEGRPVYITLPHFLHASSKLFQFVDGLKPDEEEHKTFLDVEPTTGFTLHYAKRLQINMLVRQNSKITVLQNIKHHFIFPVLWMNETAIISDEKAELFRSKVTDKIKLLNISQIVLISLGSVMFLGFLIAVCACKKTSPK
ncbi:platelet glycoprotein 4-like isoform X3 [Pantherophis guttatus]|uniref:Platelet glycoprotein 4 n=1 Tax=Pantherophis guttatus TaxID=94885 RepID=A0A6P9DBE3_PANGU|nr:platelet glycoprotein 4-like isoform X3 [Pantherophis guttatus]